jgi:hypothetical protein
MEFLSFLDFGFHYFGTPYDESLCHFHLPVTEILVSNTPSDVPFFGFLGFRISRLWDSCVGESRLLASPSPGN